MENGGEGMAVENVLDVMQQESEKNKISTPEMSSSTAQSLANDDTDGSEKSNNGLNEDEAVKNNASLPPMVVKFQVPTRQPPKRSGVNAPAEKSTEEDSADLSCDKTIDDSSSIVTKQAENDMAEKTLPNGDKQASSNDQFNCEIYFMPEKLKEHLENVYQNYQNSKNDLLSDIGIDKFSSSDVSGFWSEFQKSLKRKPQESVDPRVAERRAKDAERKRKQRASMTEEELAEFRVKDAARHRAAFASMPPEKKAARRALDALQHRHARMLMSVEELEARRIMDAARHRKAYAETKLKKALENMEETEKNEDANSNS